MQTRMKTASKKKKENPENPTPYLFIYIYQIFRIPSVSNK